MQIRDLADALNQAAARFEIGNLQKLRARLHGRRVTSPKIFAGPSIQPTYAFHYGGRTELQFNIGEERRDGQIVVRHGVAFSLETSQALPSIELLVPKIRRFNEYVRERPEDFFGFCMWHEDREGSHRDHPIAVIDDTLIKPGTFIFVGRSVPAPEVDVDAILTDFDRLLPLYTCVESTGSMPTPEKDIPFRAGCPKFLRASTVRVPTLTTAIDLRHAALQRILYDQLCQEHGRDGVACEHHLGFGVRVDVAVKTPDGFTFYEVKTESTVQACVRSAIGQLLEYAYWPSARRAETLVIVGEAPPDEAAVAYLGLLRDRFHLPLWYRQLSLLDESLDPRT